MVFWFWCLGWVFNGFLLYGGFELLGFVFGFEMFFEVFVFDWFNVG